MSPRTGRPISDNPRHMRVEVKMTKDELEKLDLCCQRLGKTRSELVRDGIRYFYDQLNKFEEK